MADIHILSEAEAITRIVKTVKWAQPGTAPFALVIGSGFSHGLVPTVRELIEDAMPLWVESLNGNESFESLRQSPIARRNSIARAFWQQFIEQNALQKLDLKLHPDTGLPEDPSAAYKAAFHPRFVGAMGEPVQARDFQRALMQLDQPRLNAAHFLLASLLGVQPGKKRESKLFKARAAFSRLILTTNFDPFLQIALQAVNRLYFMSDTPQLGVGDETFDDQTDAIHLVYLHGSIHRRSQAATDDDIAELKKQNARVLAPVLRCRGVIVLGYSGWDDTIVEALAACDSFDGRLYWCGREPDPLVKGVFGPRVTDILHKPAAMYVQIKSAGHFMAQLCNQLVEGIPRLLDNPIGQLREMLEMIDLKELEHSAPSVPTDSQTQQQQDIRPDPSAFFERQKYTIAKLARIEKDFFRSPVVSSVINQLIESAVPERTKFVEQSTVLQYQVKSLLSSAGVAEALGNYEESIRLCTECLGLDNLQYEDKIKALIMRGRALYFLGQLEEALADWTSAIETPEISTELMAEALYNRGVIWGQKGESDKELQDYSRLIELNDAPINQVAVALCNRGVVWDQKGEFDKAIKDYSQVLELNDAPIDPVAVALYSRGVVWGRKGETDKELQDYSQIIGMQDAPTEYLARAFYNRGVVWNRKGEPDKAIQDYSRIIEMSGAPIEQVEKALLNRGIIWGQTGKVDKELQDYSRIIELHGATTEMIAQALLNRGVIWGQKGNIDNEIQDYSRIIELDGIPTVQVAKALFNRGVVWGQKGEIDKELQDYLQVLSLTDVSAEMIAKTLGNRGWLYYRQKEYPAFLADTEAALSKDPSLDFAAFNLGLALLVSNRDKEALEAYSRAAEQFPKKIETLGIPDIQEAQKSWLTVERAKPILDLLQSYQT